jgi:ABC-2 type transport system ATP-binding protein
MITVSHITRSFGRTKALDDVSFSVDDGQTALLSGPNGAGKTTLLRILAGYAPANSGQGSVAGRDLFYDDSEELLDIRRVIGYVPETLPLYDDMIVGEFLRFRGRLHELYGSVLRRHCDEAIEACGLQEHRARPIGVLSRGLRARVALAAAILHRPEVLLLDDPIASIDATQRRHFLDALRNAASTRTTLFATHTPDDAAGLFNRVLLLSKGRLVLDAPLDTAHPPLSLSATVTGWLHDIE